MGRLHTIVAAQRSARTKLIHQLARELHLNDGADDSAYRAMLLAQTGHNSCTSCSVEQLGQVIDFLKGRKPGEGRGKGYPGRPNNTDSCPQLRKIEALLADSKKPWGYAAAIARRQFKKERLEFCSSVELSGVITALVHNAQREPPTPPAAA